MVYIWCVYMYNEVYIRRYKYGSKGCYKGCIIKGIIICDAFTHPKFMAGLVMPCWRIDSQRVLQIMRSAHCTIMMQMSPAVCACSGGRGEERVVEEEGKRE